MWKKILAQVLNDNHPENLKTVLRRVDPTQLLYHHLNKYTTKQKQKQRTYITQ